MPISTTLAIIVRTRLRTWTRVMVRRREIISRIRRWSVPAALAAARGHHNLPSQIYFREGFVTVYPVNQIYVTGRSFWRNAGRSGDERP